MLLFRAPDLARPDGHVVDGRCANRVLQAACRPEALDSGQHDRHDLVALARTQLQNQLNGHKDDLKKQLQNTLQDLLK